MRGLQTGNPLDDGVRVGPMVRENDAIRVQEWIRDAAATGGLLVAGGERDKAIVEPAVGLTPFESVDAAIASANDTNYGLSAAIFTESLDNAMRTAKEVESGNIHVNWGTQWRADLMPYGGLNESGFGKEGPRYAVEEMTETKIVVMHLP